VACYWDDADRFSLLLSLWLFFGKLFGEKKMIFADLLSWNWSIAIGS
jgi:hypothetical protein